MQMRFGKEEGAHISLLGAQREEEEGEQDII